MAAHKSIDTDRFALRTIFALAGIALIIIVFTTAVRLAEKHQSSRQTPSAPRNLLISLSVDGVPIEAVNGDIVNVVRGAEVILHGVFDQQTGEAVYVACTVGGERVVKQGEPFSFTHPGVQSLDLKSTGETWMTSQDGYGDWPILDSITLEVTRYPRHDVHVHVRRLDAPMQLNGMRGLEAEVILSSDEFDIEHIYLNRLSFWLLDDSNGTLDRLGIAEICEHGRSPNAEYLDGRWTLRFARPADATPLMSRPTRVMVTGKGWVGEEHLRFSSRSVALPASLRVEEWSWRTD